LGIKVRNKCSATQQKKPLAGTLPLSFPQIAETKKQRLLSGSSEAIGSSIFETVRVGKDGTPARYLLTVSPVKDGAGRIVGASTVARNITEQKIGVEALRLAEEKYRAIFEESVMEFFKSPLTVVL